SAGCGAAVPGDLDAVGMANARPFTKGVLARVLHRTIIQLRALHAVPGDPPAFERAEPATDRGQSDAGRPHDGRGAIDRLALLRRGIGADVEHDLGRCLLSRLSAGVAL